jgi:hypothetical protein
MKRFTNGLSVIAFFAVVAGAIGYSTALSQLHAQETIATGKSAPQTLAAKLVGTWKLEEASTPGSPSGVGTRLKLFTGTHWCVIQPDPKSGEIVFQHGGRYELDGDKMKTKTDFAGESTKAMIGQSGTLTIKVDGDTMTQADADGVFNETWKRVK